MNVTYLQGAIKSLYGENDDFLLIGLTGRTGSGCSTAADILSSQKDQIKHNLYSNEKIIKPITNQQRKERIISRFFNTQWEPFNIINVRSIIFLELAKRIDEIGDFLSQFKISSKQEKRLKETLKEAKVEKEKIDHIPALALEFYTTTIAAMCRRSTEAISKGKVIEIYQKIGENVRKSSNPIDSTVKPDSFFTLAKSINNIIAEIRKDHKKVYLVIDSIRNPLEAFFFQERYAAFYLTAVSCVNSERISRLIELGYSTSEIKAIDDKEYPENPVDIGDDSSYSVQDIHGCLQRADLYITNPNVTSEAAKFKDLTNQLVTFVALMRRPGIITPTPIERCMQIAYTAKLNSGCISRQVGAVVSDQNYSIKSVGWNDTPHGQVPCNLRNRIDAYREHDSNAYSEFEKNDIEYRKCLYKKNEKLQSIKIFQETGRNLSYCFKSEYNASKENKEQIHTRALHAEENAFLQISKYGGHGIEGGYLFTTASPCELCAKKAYQLGIKQIYYIDPYPGIATQHIINGGIKNPKLMLFSGAIGKAFHQLYSPIVSYKDELNALSK